MMLVDRRVHRVPSSSADEDSKASLEGTRPQCARRGPSAGPLSRCGRTELSSFVVKKQTHLPREPVGRQVGGRGAHGFWGPGDFRSETPHHCHTGISAGGVTFAPLISASDAWVVFSQAHFYKDQRPSRPSQDKGARPISKAGVGPIQGTGLPRPSRRCLSPPLARALLLRDPGTAPSPPLPLRMPQARSALPALDLA